MAVDAGAEMIGPQDTAAEGATGQALGVLVAEMQAMRAEIERLRIVVEEKEQAQLPPASPTSATEYGPLVRAAMWLEGLLRRSR